MEYVSKKFIRHLKNVHNIFKQKYSIIIRFLFAAETIPSPRTKSPRPGDEKIEPPEDDSRKDFIGPQLEMSGATGVAEGDEDDPCRSEGTVRFVIPNFSKLSEQILSGPTYIRNLPWLVCGGGLP